VRTTSLSRPAQPSRILLDLAQGELDEQELAAVAAWIKASSRAQPPQDLVDRALSLRQGLVSSAS